MNAVDGSDHYSKTSDDPPPSLLTIILDTNPHAWALLAPNLPLSAVLANLLVFVNAHLAISNVNKVAIIASHSQRAEFLYPRPPNPKPTVTATSNGNTAASRKRRDKHTRDKTNGAAFEDTEMRDAVFSGLSEPDSDNGSEDGDATDNAALAEADANHYRPFQHVQSTLMLTLQNLYASTAPTDLTPTTAMAGALTLALTYINRQHLNASASTARGDKTSSSGGAGTTGPTIPGNAYPQSTALLPRILILSVSGDLAHQYIPIMNTIFACQRLSIPIDIAKLAGDTVFLQQASDATGGTYIRLEHPRGLLQYLMMAYLPDQLARKALVQPNQVGVDFRAACFCHRRVVDVGFVCSVCLSIFCSPPEGALCLTCGTHLRLGNYGGKPVVVAKRKKKKKDK